MTDDEIDEIISEVICLTCSNTKRVSCPGPSIYSQYTQKELDILGLRPIVDYCYGMHMGHTCPDCISK